MKKYAKIPPMKESTKNYKNMTKIATFLLSATLLFTACSPSEPEPEILEATKQEETLLQVQKDAEVKRQKELFKKRHTKTFQECFYTGRVAVNDHCFKEIKNFLKDSKKEDKQLIIIEVHTDKAGGKYANLNISKKRAYDIAKNIYKLESKNSNVYYEGFGEEKPLVDKESKEANKINRRIKITLKDKNYAVNTKEFKKFVPVKKKKVAVKQKVKKPKKVEVPKMSVSKVNFNSMGVQESSSIKKHASKFQSIKKKKPTLESKKVTSKKVEKTRVPRKYQAFQKYTGSADTGWMYFGKKELKDKFYLTCTEDSPIKMKHKAISSSKKSEFMRGVYNKRVSGEYGDNYIELYPVYIYENGALPTSNPILTLYDDSRGIKRYQTTINTYRGTKGILYRVFVNGNKDIKCLDLVISYKSKEISYGKVYTNEDGKVKEYKFKAEE